MDSWKLRNKHCACSQLLQYQHRCMMWYSINKKWQVRHVAYLCFILFVINTPKYIKICAYLYWGFDPVAYVLIYFIVDYFILLRYLLTTTDSFRDFSLIIRRDWIRTTYGFGISIISLAEKNKSLKCWVCHILFEYPVHVW